MEKQAVREALVNGLRPKENRFDKSTGTKHHIL